LEPHPDPDQTSWRTTYPVAPTGLVASQPLARKEAERMLLLPGEKGQGLVEYSLILLLVALAVIIVLVYVGPAVGNLFSSVVPSI
jgi:Flp pilus assembly pilin Flp